MDTKTAPELWFGTEHNRLITNRDSNDKPVLCRPIHIKNTPGSGWKFDVVTHAEPGNHHAVGEVLTITQPTNRDPYTSLTYLPTMLSSGLRADARIEANMYELLFYVEFLHEARAELLMRWPELKVSPKRQEQLELIIDEVRAGLSKKSTDLPKQATAKKPHIVDSLGRSNPGAASAGITAITGRLVDQMTLEKRGLESMRKRRYFANTLIYCYSQDIWDMSFLGRYKLKTRQSELQKRIDRALIKPMLFAGLYCQREFANNLGHPLVLARVIEVFSTEIQLIAVRNLFASLAQYPNSHKETLYKVRLLLAMTPNEKLYLDLFEELQDYASDIGKVFTREPKTVKRLAIKAKTRIRNRANSNPSHPWFVETNPLPQP